MANNNYNRKTAARDGEFSESDPLAELARIVGYDPRRPQEPADVRPEPQIDLEAELLHELKGFDEPAQDDFESNPPAEARAVEADEARADTDAPFDFTAEAPDEAELSDEMMTISLEDELLREFEAEQTAPASWQEEAREAAAPADSEDLSRQAHQHGEEASGAPEWQPETATPPAAEAYEPEPSPEAGAVDAEQQPFEDAASSLFAEPEAEDEGFSFPSMDEMEEDTDFAEGAWDGRSEAAPLDIRPESLRLLESNLPVEPASAAALGHSKPAPEAAMPVPADAAPEPQPIQADDDAGQDTPPTDAADEGVGAYAAVEPEQLLDAEGAAEQDTSVAWQDNQAPEVALDEAALDAFLNEGLDAAEDHVGEEPAAVPAPQGDPQSQNEQPRFASSDDILADIDRFSLPASGADTGQNDETMAPPAVAEPEDATRGDPAAAPAGSGSPLDEWLAATTEAEERAKDRDVAADRENVVDLYSPTEPVQPETLPAEAERVGPEAATILDGDESTEAAAAEQGVEPAAASSEQTDETPEAAPPDEQGKPAGAGPAREPRQPPTVPSWLRRAAAPAASAVGAIVADKAAQPQTSSQPPSSFDSRILPEAADDDGKTFDASALAEHDETVEPTPVLDIPRLPEEEKVEAQAQDEDFGFDVDADFIGLLEGDELNAATELPSEPEAEREPATSEVPTATASDGAALGDTSGHATAHFDNTAYAGIDYDDLERALDASLDQADAEATAAPLAAEHEDAVRPAAKAGIAAAAARFGGWRPKQIGVTAAGVVLIAAIGIFVWDAGSPQQAESGGPRVISADKTPVKQKPADPGGKTVPNQNKIVYDRVDGTQSDGPQQKDLLTSAEKPVDIVQRTLQPDQPDNAGAAGGEPDGPPANSASSAPSKGQARLSPGSQMAPATPSSAVPRGVEPHFVRTMTVTADGKLVPAAQAGSDGQATGAGSISGQAPAAPQTMSSPPAAPAGGSASQTMAAPLPAPRPQHGAPQAGSAQPASAATATPAPANGAPEAAAPAAGNAQQASAAPSAAAPANPGGYFIQIASQPTEAGAKASYQNLSSRYASVIGGHGVDIQRAEISGKGVYYRVRIPAGSREEAVSLCGNYKGAGGSCFVTR